LPTTRTYGDGCGIARALDAVGERWALLVVRELLLGPQRFSDLRRALPNASSNLVADRLRELTGHGVVRRRRLPAPAASWVYELTEAGQQLEPILDALGGWGLRFPRPDGPVTISAVSVLLYLRGSVQPERVAAPVTCRIELDERVWSLRIAAGHVSVATGEPAGPDVSFRSTPPALSALIDDPSHLGQALSDGTLDVTGDVQALHTVFDAIA
jgi:DNA-binding HxlR family transcriptional regulator